MIEPVGPRRVFPILNSIKALCLVGKRRRDLNSVKHVADQSAYPSY